MAIRKTVLNTRATSYTVRIVAVWTFLNQRESAFACFGLNFDATEPNPKNSAALLSEQLFFFADNTTYNVLDGERAILPCNITAPSSDDAVSLVLWYKYETVLYTVDARSSVSLESAQHFLHTDIEKRASFNLSYPLSFLRIKPIKSSDGGDYRCRVDFRRGRTVNRILKLTVIGEWIYRLLM